MPAPLIHHRSSAADMIKQGLVGDHGVDRDVEGVGDRKVVEFAHDAVEDSIGQVLASLERKVDVRPALPGGRTVRS